jgi:hypothetical protein
MAGSPDPLFVVESLVQGGGGPLVLARRLDDHDFVVRDGSLLSGVPITAADMPRHLNTVGAGKGDLWGFWLKSASDSANFASGQTVKLQHPTSSVEHEWPLRLTTQSTGWR